MKQYECPLKKWYSFCQVKNIDPLVINIIEVQNFLTEEFKKGASYGTVNCYRSALSLILSPEIASDIGIKRICKGVSKLRPQTPKYNVTWNPKIVLDFLTSWAPNNDILLEQLSYKLITLLALITGHRIQTLSLIKLSNIRILTERIEIKIPAQIKTSKPGRKQPVLILPFFSNKDICVAQTLKYYIDRTKNLRNDNDTLFLSFKKPHKPAGTQTLSRWIKKVLHESGVDTSFFSAYSVRHASTSAAKRMGVNIDTIRSMAGWTEDSKTFTKFYDLKVVDDPSTFANTILKL